MVLFEYLLQVPANRVVATQFSLAQLKIMQEVITLAGLVPFAVIYMDQPMKLDFLWAGICMLGPVHTIFPGGESLPNAMVGVLQTANERPKNFDQDEIRAFCRRDYSSPGYLKNTAS